MTAQETLSYTDAAFWDGVVPLKRVLPNGAFTDEHAVGVAVKQVGMYYEQPHLYQQADARLVIPLSQSSGRSTTLRSLPPTVLPVGGVLLTTDVVRVPRDVGAALSPDTVFDDTVRSDAWVVCTANTDRQVLRYWARAPWFATDQHVGDMRLAPAGVALYSRLVFGRWAIDRSNTYNGPEKMLACRIIDALLIDKERYEEWANTKFVMRAMKTIGVELNQH